MAMLYDSDNHLISEYGFDGSAGWDQRSVTEGGFYAVSGQLLASMRRDADFYREINLKILYPRITFKDKERIGDNEVYVIEAIPDDGSAERLYFDVRTGLLARRDEQVEFPQGSAELKIYFEDYKEVDGVKLVWASSGKRSTGYSRLSTQPKKMVWELAFHSVARSLRAIVVVDGPRRMTALV
jgi:hypothetical protein